MTVYTNISNTFNIRMKSGIQRVVREIVARVYQDDDIALIAWNNDAFYHLGADDQVANFLDAKESHTEQRFSFDQLARGDIFLDLDASWSDPYDIEQLFRQLKSRGVIIVKLHCDAVPVLFPEFSHPNTVFAFTENFTAALQYSDYWLCISHTVEQDLHKIAESLNVGRPVTQVLPLGADFNLPATKEDVKLPTGLGKYVLCVGTLEPRKNYSLVLEVFERWCADGNDANLVIVGKQGWNVAELASRLDQHPLANLRLFWLKQASDAEVDVLYKNAYLTLNLASYEGYGLPVVESLSRGCVTLCSKGGAMEEVSRDAAYCVESSVEGATQAIEQLMQGDAYDEYKERANQFQPPSWSSTASLLRQFLGKCQIVEDIAFSPRQAVYISIRPDSVKRSSDSIVRHMPFIDRAIILTSDDTHAAITQKVKDIPLALTILKESELGITDLPEDHQARNTYLRRKLYSHDAVDPNFIAFDDDYLVLKPVTPDDFIEGDVHKAHYFFDKGENWLGGYLEGTSFDKGLWRTTQFLASCGYDTRLYNAHMPQIINKGLCCMILDRTAGMALDEWSSYFNIAKHLYPHYFADTLYRAMGWPDPRAPWLPESVPNNIAFMNYYKGNKINQLRSQDKTETIITAWADTIGNRFAIQRSISPHHPMVTVLPGKLVSNFDEIHCPEDALLSIKMQIDNQKFSLKVAYGHHLLEFDEQSTPLWISIPPHTFTKGGNNQLKITLANPETAEIFTLQAPIIVE
ncbi:MAG: glycosyltransferase family 1 protein [Halioglobus sp.]